jgi:hypothetical protein
MANIVKFEKGSSYKLSLRSGNPTDVYCIYEVQTLVDGSKMVVIKTYNPISKNGSISQTIHFTKKSAIELIEIFKKEFNL